MWKQEKGMRKVQVLMGSELTGYWDPHTFTYNFAGDLDREDTGTDSTQPKAKARLKPLNFGVKIKNK